VSWWSRTWLGIILRLARQRAESEIKLRAQLKSIAASARELYAANQMLMDRLRVLESELDAACQMMSDEMISDLMEGELYDWDAELDED
jgi:hypothetical protein